MNSGLVTARTDWPVRPATFPATLVALLAIAGVTGLAVSGLSPAWFIVLSLVFCTYAGWHVHRLLSPCWKRLRTDSEGAVLVDRRGRACSILPDEHSFVSPVFAGFRCRCADSGKYLSAGLFRAQLGDEAFRRLSVLLREGSPT